MVRRRVPLALTLALLVLAALCPRAEAKRGPRPITFRAMTFNIRFDYKDDGPNRWHRRVELVAETIRESKASVVMLQEDMGDQIDDLQPHLPGFAFVGRGRNANGRSERCSVGFDTRLWKLVKNGDFWLSDSPDEPGSNTWGTRYPHKVTWALLRAPKARNPVLFLSTHFEDKTDKGRVREKSAQVIRDFLKREALKMPVVLGGDFNSGPDDPPHALLVNETAQPRLLDAWSQLKPASEWAGTVHFFKGKGFRRRIDWILHSRQVASLGVEIFKHERDGRWPSDHFPLYADLAVR